MSEKGTDTEAQRYISNYLLDSLMSSYMYSTDTLIFGKNFEAIKCIAEAQVNTAAKCVHSKSPLPVIWQGS